MLTDPVFYALAIPAIILLGLGKGGFSGFGSAALPLLALTMSPVQAAAIMLPIMIVQDVVGVWSFRKTWDGNVLWVMLPGAVAGIVLGWLLAAQVSANAVMAALGAISILFALQRLWVERGGRIAASASSPPWIGTLLGVVSGFTSQIAHAGAPPFQMWVIPKRLDHLTFAGTAAIFFAIVNWMKVPAYMALGQFTRENMLTAAALLPLAIGSTFAGVVLVRRVTGTRFYTVIYLLMIFVGAKLLWDALA
ncbi:sulfite exporter TauE/SafE family protein [Sphingobium boeckii]|nr:sulfite exporter TauE/SafE family protein [Sphingobium boeckii]